MPYIMFIFYHFFASNLTRILNAQKGIPQTANGKLQTAVCSPWETSILRCLMVSFRRSKIKRRDGHDVSWKFVQWRPLSNKRNAKFDLFQGRLSFCPVNGSWRDTLANRVISYGKRDKIINLTAKTFLFVRHLVCCAQRPRKREPTIYPTKVSCM